MKKILLLLFVGLSQFVFAQVDTVAIHKIIDIDTIFTAPENIAEFVGGQEKYYEFVLQHVKYPEVARVNSVQGRAVVRFVIEKNGEVGNVECVSISTNSSDLLEAYRRKLKKKNGTVEEYQKMLESCNNVLKEEGIRVMKQLTKWKPASQNRVVVRSYVTFPFRFQLEG